MDKILECVPNFSEGKNLNIIRAIGEEIRNIQQLKLLHVDPGPDANRTVFTFAGHPEAVIEAAFLAIKKAGELIDMSIQQGVHPRMGATDVCPLIPVKGIDMEEANTLAHRLGKRVGEELSIPVFMYEYSANTPERKNLATIRKGEYEGFRQKILLDEWKPDYGPQSFNEKAGQTVIGARDFLIAYNVNLQSQDLELANFIASRIRESGFKEKVDGQWKRRAGQLKAVKAIGWRIPEYDMCQVSTNLVNYRVNGMHQVYEAVKSLANAHGVMVNGSELIGMVPEETMSLAGNFYATEELSNQSLVELAIKSMGLEAIRPFTPEHKILEWALKN